jgi:excisionase family DNA binding protein
MNNQYDTIETVPDLLNVRELSSLLRISNTGVYRLVESRKIPFYRLPRGLRFDRKDVEAFLSQLRVEII